MGNRSTQPSGSPTGASGSKLMSEESNQSEKSKKQSKELAQVTGLGISISPHGGKRGSRSPAGKTAHSPDDEKQNSRRYSPKGPGQKRQKKRTKIHQERSIEPVERSETNSNFWDRADNYDGEIGNLFESKPPKVIKKNVRIRADKFTIKGAKIETTHPELIERFHNAAASGNAEEVRQMLVDGIDVSVTDPKNHDATALHLAAKSGEESVVRILLQNGAEIDSGDGGEKTPLYWAAKQGNASTVEYLLRMNASRGIRTVNGWTPLHTAARDGSDEVLTVLLKYGFQVEARSNDGLTPLFLAVQNERRNSALLLLQAGANPKLKNHAGGSPIQEAISEYNKTMLNDMLRALVPDLEDEAYEDMMFCLGTESDEFQNSTLLSAIEYADDELLRLFLALGVDEENLNEEGYNLLHQAVLYGNDTTVQVLLENGANTETRTADGATALLLAAKCNQAEVAAVLLDHNANIEAKMLKTGQTALHIAANLASSPENDAENAKKLVRILLSGGFYFGVTDNNGDTPLALARRVKDQARAATEILLNPPAVKGRSGYEQSMPPASTITNDETRVCKAFDAFLVDFYQREKEPPAEEVFKSSPGKRTRRNGNLNTQKRKKATVLFDRVDWLPRIKSVHEVTHSKGPKKIMEEASSNMRLGSKHLFRWIHVPANNIAWVKDLVHKICLEEGSTKHQFEDMANFVSKTGSEHWGAMAHSRYMKTCFTVQGASALGTNDNQNGKRDEEEVEEYMDTKLAIYMPFLNFDTTASRKEIAAIVKEFESRDSENSASFESPQKSHFSRRKPGNSSTRGKKDVTKVLESALNPRERHVRKFSESDTFNLARDGGYIYSLTGDRLPTTDHAALFDEHDTSKIPLGHLEKYRVLLREYLSHRHGSLHISRTLDQFYYNSIRTDTRDQDQVVYRFFQENRTPKIIAAPEPFGFDDSVSPTDETTEQRDTDEKPICDDNPRIFTVDQMWIWIIDEETIISSFPQRWEEEASQEPKVLETIQAHLTEKNRPQVKSVYEMAAMITSYCIRFADKCSVQGVTANGKEFEESFLQVYASAVSKEADREATLFREFQSQITLARDEAKAILTLDKDEVPKKRSYNGRGKKMTTQDVFASKKFRIQNPLEQTTELPVLLGRHTQDTTKPGTLELKGSKMEIPSELPTVISTTEIKDKPSGDSTDTDEEKDKDHYKRKLEQKADICGEMEVLKVIKDIRDELNILHRILTEQKSVTNKLFNPENRLKMNPDVQDFYLEQSGLDRRIQDVEKMDKDAERTYLHVNNLLDLKQKQANIDEALAGAKQGDIAIDQGRIAVDHARVASDQGAVVLIFTLVTIIFLPMSFLTSLYALNISAFPHDDKGELAYPSAYLFSRLFGISTAIACVLLTLAFQVRRIRRLFQEQSEKFDNYRADRRKRKGKPPPASKKGARRPKHVHEDQDAYYEERHRGSLSLGFRRDSEGPKYTIRRAERLDFDERTPSPKETGGTHWGGGEGVDGDEVEKRGFGVDKVGTWFRGVLGMKRVGDVEARSVEPGMMERDFTFTQARKR